jgi:hypothetical protein
MAHWITDTVPVTSSRVRACFVVAALAGLALAGGVRRPLLAYVASWWVLLGIPRAQVGSDGPMWLGVLRI